MATTTVSNNGKFTWGIVGLEEGFILKMIICKYYEVKHGEVQCRPIQCPPINCKNPVYKPGECCPTCLKQCFLRGNMYDHGESVSFKQCVECTCQNGYMPCKRIDPETMCPPLTCSPKEQFSVPEECCKFCPGVDYCSKGHMCHENATCLNLQTTYACQCNNGYFGDGHLCRDVDECLQAGGLEGHHCHSNTRCVNTPGSYVCECLPGYRRLDKFNCVELDECSTGEHGCHANAACVNTLGSYHCQCHEGYIGDGYQCKPVCNQTCLNGGECVAPGQCQCRRGYMGPSCELDLDECTSDVHNCHESSQCVNMPGWYYCRCRPGFRSMPNHYSALGAICQDIDECTESIHSCHPTSHCVNTEGGFQCSCDVDDSHECRLSCMFEGSEIENGKVVSPSGQPCRRCECVDGVISCKDPTCDCNQRGSHNDKCCPQCDPTAACHHQELRHVVFRSGERWIYQCQTCECLYGEIDCWPMECPPLLCSDPILAPGDCCPRCEDDPCSFDNTGNKTIGQPCMSTYTGRLFNSGTTTWQNPHDKCSACNCKVPYCAQLVSNTACCVHRMGAFAAAMISSVLVLLKTNWHSCNLHEVSHHLHILKMVLVKFLMKVLTLGWLALCHRKQKFGRLQLWTGYKKVLKNLCKIQLFPLKKIVHLLIVALKRSAVLAVLCLRLLKAGTCLQMYIVIQVTQKLMSVQKVIMTVILLQNLKRTALYKLKILLTSPTILPDSKNVKR